MSEENNNNQMGGQKPATVELRSEGLELGGGKKPINKKMAGIIIGVIALLIIVGLGVYAAMRQTAGSTDVSGQDKGIFGDLPQAGEKDKEPATESGFSGMPCDHAERRAIGVMLAGDPVNRPLSGASKADMMWELPVLASNVTRLMGVYQCGEPTEIGSVRSARHDYLFLAEGLDAILAHWGGSYHALNRIAVGEFQTLNALVNPDNAFFRKNDLPAPYNGFTSYDRLWKALQALGYRTTSNFHGYDFKDDASSDQRPAGGTLTVSWPGQFRVSYEYDPVTNRYVRYWAGVKQVDAEDNQVVAPSAVVVVRATNGPMTGPGGYNDVGIEGSGEMEVYQDGAVIKGTWRKNELEKKDPTHFLDENGKPVVFTRGQVWVMAPSADVPVTWTVQ
ncbi:MAG: DUF3048 domain-containing protein [Candidatus Andersenbacteria bacterium]|nr:DUF3048 domain-containing protein [bacterium]MDZ4225499.1 DUF3048 domain-containing protein [Candidatus Andersenbacteria bacterium]